MTIQEFIDYVENNNISKDIHIAIRAKDDYLLTEDKVYLDKPYFNYIDPDWAKDNLPISNNEIDWDNLPNFLILDSEND